MAAEMDLELWGNLMASLLAYMTLNCVLGCKYGIVRRDQRYFQNVGQLGSKILRLKDRRLDHQHTTEPYL